MLLVNAIPGMKTNLPYRRPPCLALLRFSVMFFSSTIPFMLSLTDTFTGGVHYFRALDTQHTEKKKRRIQTYIIPKRNVKMLIA